MFHEISKKASLRAKEKFMSYVVTTVYILYLSCLQKFHREDGLSKEVLCQEEKRRLTWLCVHLDHYMTGYRDLANTCRTFGFQKIGEVVSGHVMKVYKRRRCTFPHILNLGTRWRWAVILTSRAHNAWKELQNPLSRRISGSHSLSWRL